MTTHPIIKSISSPRLSSYKTIFCCTDDESCIPYYRWNTALSAELYILLSTIEVCLRNQIHTELSKATSVKFNLPLSNNFAWYDYFSFIETDQNGNAKTNSRGEPIYTETGKAFRKITHNKNGNNRNRLPQIIISKLEFGKWSYVLLAKKYSNSNLINWNDILPLIFPYFKGLTPKKHQLIIDRIKTVKDWRNRLAHLEPVWKFKDVKDPVTGKVLVREPVNEIEVIKRLNSEVNRAMQLLSWLCKDTHNHYKTTSYINLKKILSHSDIVNYFS